MTDITFEDARWFWAMLAFTPVAFLGLRWFVSMTRLRRWSAVVSRLVLTGLVLAMLAGASSIRRMDRMVVIGVLDISGSVRRFASGSVDAQGKPVDPLEASKRFFIEATANRGADDLAGLVVFDGRALSIASPTRGELGDRTVDVASMEGTDLAQALRTAAAMIPPDATGRLVVISDGVETTGDALGVARELRQPVQTSGKRATLPVDVVPLTYNVTREVIVERVDAPPRASSEAPITVRVSLRAAAPSSGTLILMRENEPIDINGAEPGVGRRVKLNPGLQVELIQVDLPPGRVHRFRAVYEPDHESDGTTLSGDTRLENNQAEAFTTTPGRGSVLIVDGVGGGSPTGSGATLARALTNSQIETTLLPSAGLPGDVLSLQAYDLVILQNVAADEIDDAAQHALVAHVKDLGGGLVMVGGPDSLGPGGWKGTPVEPILPVRLDLPEQLVQPDAAIALILDNSGSMRFSVMNSLSSQQEIANQAAAIAVRTLDKKDLITVITFNSQPSLLQAIQPNTDPKLLGERILSIAPDGGTNLPPALDMAREQLDSVKASLKHIIVLTDGRSQNAGWLPDMARVLKDRHNIRVSAIAVGDGADEQTLAEMAREGGGSYYPVKNPQTLPKLFVKAIRVVRSPMIREGRFKPIVPPTGSPLTMGLDTPPDLLGVVITQPRPEPTITYSMLTNRREPLLADWTVELGRVAVFASDAHAWAEPWLSWSGYQKMWTQIARVIGRSSSPSRFELATEVVNDRLRVRLDAMDDGGRPVDLLSVPGTLFGPSGETLDFSLTQTGPGIYEAEMPGGQSGNYITVLKPTLGTQRLAPLIGGTAVSAGVEYRRLTDDRERLIKIADATGGRVLDLATPDAARLFDNDGAEPVYARTPLWRPLMLVTLCVLLLDVATRRIAWDRMLGGAVRSTAMQATAAAALTRLRDRGVKGAEVLTALDESAATALGKQAAEERWRRRTHGAREEPSATPTPATSAPVVDRTGASAPITDATKASEESGETGLLAAKRRARHRLDSGE